MAPTLQKKKISSRVVLLLVALIGLACLSMINAECRWTGCHAHSAGDWCSVLGPGYKVKKWEQRTLGQTRILLQLICGSVFMRSSKIQATYVSTRLDKVSKVIFHCLRKKIRPMMLETKLSGLEIKKNYSLGFIL